MSGICGLDVGTNCLVSARLGLDGNVVFGTQRDAFYEIVPKSEVNRNTIKTSLDKRGADYIISGETFVVVGEDALDLAIERNDIVKRPLSKGVISPKEKDSLPILKHIITNLIGKSEDNSTIVYSVPAKPIDSDFDIEYHKQMLNKHLSSIGYIPSAINESFAIGLAELVDFELSGIAASFGAGMINIAVLHYGEPVVEFSITKSGDYIDKSVATALDLPVSLIQKEKENIGLDLLNIGDNKIAEALGVYYGAVIEYSMKSMLFELNMIDKKTMPSFTKPIPIVVSGGLTMVGGFVEKIEEALNKLELPFKVSGVKRASDPLKAVAQGCLLAAQL